VNDQEKEKEKEKIPPPIKKHYKVPKIDPNKDILEKILAKLSENTNESQKKEDSPITTPKKEAPPTLESILAQITENKATNQEVATSSQYNPENPSLGFGQKEIEEVISFLQAKHQLEKTPQLINRKRSIGFQNKSEK
jgi:PAB1-binding protein PBP1